MKKKSMKVRVDKDVWERCRGLFPKETDATISRVLYGTSLVKVEKNLKDKDFRDKLGGFLFGKKSWKSWRQTAKK